MYKLRSPISNITSSFEDDTLKITLYINGFPLTTECKINNFQSLETKEISSSNLTIKSDNIKIETKNFELVSNKNSIIAADNNVIVSPKNYIIAESTTTGGINSIIANGIKGTNAATTKVGCNHIVAGSPDNVAGRNDIISYGGYIAGENNIVAGTDGVTSSVGKNLIHAHSTADKGGKNSLSIGNKQYRKGANYIDAEENIIIAEIRNEITAGVSGKKAGINKIRAHGTEKTPAENKFVAGNKDNIAGVNVIHAHGRNTLNDIVSGQNHIVAGNRHDTHTPGINVLRSIGLKEYAGIINIECGRKNEKTVEEMGKTIIFSSNTTTIVP